MEDLENIYKKIIEEGLKDESYPKCIYHNNGLVTITSKDFVCVMSTSNWEKALKEAAKKYLND